MAKPRVEEMVPEVETIDALAVTADGVIPSFITKGDMSGTETIAPEDARIPRLVLAQPQTPQAMKGKPEYIDGLSAGDSFNDLTEVIYGDGPLDVVIIRADRPRWVQFGEDRKVVDPSVPFGDPRTQFTTDASGDRIPPEATEFHDYVVLLGEKLEPMALSFKSTAIKLSSRVLNGLIKMKPAPIYACRYRLTPKMMQNDKGNWYIFSVKQVGFISSETIFNRAKDAYDAFKVKAVDFDTSPKVEDDDTIAGGPVSPTDM